VADVQFGYDRGSQRYRDLSTGRWVSERSVRDAVDRTADHASRLMGDAAARFRAGTIDAGQWLAESMQTIKDANVAAALVAYGGRSQMTPERNGFVGSQVKIQYQYARQMVGDVLDGRQRLNGRLDSRARMYGQAARQTYTDIRRRESARNGMSFERNHLGAAEHCASCVGETARGWVPIGSLIPPGRRTCRASCRCSLAYAETMSEAA
jgi:hypothetical protein